MTSKGAFRNVASQIVLSMFALCLTLSGQSRADLVGYWKLDGDALDSSSSGVEGTLEGDIAFSNDVPNVLGGGMSVELNQGAGAGLDLGYVDLGNPDVLNFADNDWTVAAWMKTEPDHAERGNIFSNGGDYSGGIRYVLAYAETGGPGNVVLTTDDDSTKSQAVSSGFVAYR